MELPKTPPQPPKRTRAQAYLEQALIELLKTKRYEEITVKALVEQAGIARTTFYAQFEDKTQFVDRFIDTVLNEQFYVSMGSHTSIPNRFSRKGFADYYPRLFGHIEKNKVLYTRLLCDRGIPEFRRRLRALAVTIWKYKHPVDFENNLLPLEQRLKAEVLIEYVVAGHIAIIDYWLQQNPHLTPEAVVDKMMEITWGIIEAAGMEELLNY